MSQFEIIKSEETLDFKQNVRLESLTVELPNNTNQKIFKLHKTNKTDSIVNNFENIKNVEQISSGLFKVILNDDKFHLALTFMSEFDSQSTYNLHIVTSALEKDCIVNFRKSSDLHEMRESLSNKVSDNDYVKTFYETTLDYNITSIILTKEDKKYQVIPDFYGFEQEKIVDFNYKIIIGNEFSFRKNLANISDNKTPEPYTYLMLDEDSAETVHYCLSDKDKHIGKEGRLITYNSSTDLKNGKFEYVFDYDFNFDLGKGNNYVLRSDIINLTDTHNLYCSAYKNNLEKVYMKDMYKLFQSISKVNYIGKMSRFYPNNTFMSNQIKESKEIIKSELIKITDSPTLEESFLNFVLDNNFIKTMNEKPNYKQLCNIKRGFTDLETHCYNSQFYFNNLREDKFGDMFFNLHISAQGTNMYKETIYPSEFFQARLTGIDAMLDIDSFLNGEPFFYKDNFQLNPYSNVLVLNGTETPKKITYQRHKSYLTGTKNDLTTDTIAVVGIINENDENVLMKFESFDGVEYQENIYEGLKQDKISNITIEIEESIKEYKDIHTNLEKTETDYLKCGEDKVVKLDFKSLEVSEPIKREIEKEYFLSDLKNQESSFINFYDNGNVTRKHNILEEYKIKDGKYTINIPVPTKAVTKNREVFCSSKGLPHNYLMFKSHLQKKYLMKSNDLPQLDPLVPRIINCELTKNKINKLELNRIGIDGNFFNDKINKSLKDTFKSKHDCGFSITYSDAVMTFNCKGYKVAVYKGQSEFMKGVYSFVKSSKDNVKTEEFRLFESLNDMKASSIAKNMENEDLSPFICVFKNNILLFDKNKELLPFSFKINRRKTEEMKHNILIDSETFQYVNFKDIEVNLDLSDIKDLKESIILNQADLIKAMKNDKEVELIL